MSESRLTFVPRSRGRSALYLVVGLVVAVTTVIQLVRGGAAVLPVIALVAALALVAVAVIGLVAPPRLR
ncbi:hypothetical protein COUCH_13185 [Couchioplanes caeruleus]|uniref:hypothetical protein n=1 Tax=Couchioplanes caeruleus TaxID=56438 RepID=UPI0020C056B5|nr:hypothetical protein [Couchioplanes caeruleus]UQU67160.1 hypothetical protein COUCH_13185 [Couchioplanes caeruleus]